MRPIAHQSLVDRVTDELHRAILNGDIQPGSAVSIVELCEQFDVSHIPVREALRRLESEGLVSLRPGRSALVASLSPEDLADIYRLRKPSRATSHACDRADDRRAARAAQDALDEYAEIEREPGALAAPTTPSTPRSSTARRGPTAACSSCSGTSADRYLHLLIGEPRAPRRPRRRINEHRHLLDLAIAGKAEELRAAWVAHLDASAEELRSRPCSVVPGGRRVYLSLSATGRRPAPTGGRRPGRCPC